MAAFPIWATVNAAWRDVWQNKSAALRAGWPLAVYYLLLFGVEIVVLATTPAFPHVTPEDLPLLQKKIHITQFVLTPLMLVVFPFIMGGWAKFISNGESRWQLSGRNFLPILAVFGKLIAIFIAGFVIAIGGAVAIFEMSRGHQAAGVAAGIFGVIAIGALVVIGLRLSLAIPYAAITGESDLRTSFALTRPHVWRILLLGLAAGLAGLLGMIVFFLLLVLIGGLFGGVVGVSLYLLNKISWVAAIPMDIIGIAGAVAFLGGIIAMEVGLILYIRGVYIRAYLALAAPPVVEVVNPWIG